MMSHFRLPISSKRLQALLDEAELREVQKMTEFSIERCATPALPPETRAALIALCDAAYQESIAPYLEAIGPGEHLLGVRAGVLVSHLMWVTRWLQPLGLAPLRTAYVEVAATAPEAEGRSRARRPWTTRSRCRSSGSAAKCREAVTYAAPASFAAKPTSVPQGGRTNTSSMP
jgi:hypothetical protein